MSKSPVALGIHMRRGPTHRQWEIWPHCLIRFVTCLCNLRSASPEPLWAKSDVSSNKRYSFLKEAFTKQSSCLVWFFLYGFLVLSNFMWYHSILIHCLHNIGSSATRGTPSYWSDLFLMFNLNIQQPPYFTCDSTDRKVINYPERSFRTYLHKFILDGKIVIGIKGAVVLINMSEQDRSSRRSDAAAELQCYADKWSKYCYDITWN